MDKKDWILNNKVKIPELAKNHVPRKALYSLICKAEAGSIFLSGKSGFGKTAALSYFCRKKNAEVIWYCFDSSDNEIYNFIRGFMRSLTEVYPQIHGNTGRMFYKNMDFTELANRLLSDIIEVKKKERDMPLYIALDCMEKITNQRLLNLIRQWTERDDLADMILMASRERIFPCFSKGVSQGRILEITEESLSLSTEEIRQLGRKMGRGKISEESAEYISAETEGWPCMVSLLFSHLKKNKIETSELLKLSINRILMKTSVYSYISYEILGDLPKGYREFMIKSSVFDFLEAELCEECLMEKESRKILDYLSKKNIIHAGYPHERLKYSKLIREFLREQVDSEEKSVLEQRKVRFYQGKSDILGKTKKGKKIKVSTFGTFAVIVLNDKRELSWRTRKACELFSYLLSKNGKAVERRTLLRELWQEDIPVNAVAMLHNMFYNIRKELSYYKLDGLIQYKNKKYSMNMDIIQSDLEEIEKAAFLVETGDINGLYECRDMFRNYWGKFLEDMDSRWIFDKQEYFDGIFKKGCCMIAEYFIREEKYETAAIYLRNALKIDDYSEETMGKLLECYGAYNAWKEAKIVYDKFVIRLKKDLGIEPGEKLKRHYIKCMEQGAETAHSPSCFFNKNYK